MRRAAVAALACAGLLSTGLPASGVEPQVTDPRGDWPLAGQDIVSATFATTTVQRRRVLEVRLELAGAPQPDAALYWEVGWRTADCALTYVEYTRSAYSPGEESADMIRQCRPDGPFTVGGEVHGRMEGSTIVLTMPLGRRLRPGTLISEPYAMSFTFVLVHGSVPTWHQADETEKGRSYRIAAARG